MRKRNFSLINNNGNRGGRRRRVVDQCFPNLTRYRERHYSLGCWMVRIGIVFCRTQDWRETSSCNTVTINVSVMQYALNRVEEEETIEKRNKYFLPPHSDFLPFYIKTGECTITKYLILPTYVLHKLKQWVNL